MLTLNTETIALGQTATDKDHAIQQVGELLVNAGYMAEPYINSMRGREAVANTLLGNGIAIPHGLQEDRDYIHRTGIAVLQLPDGVVWKDGEKAHLIVGIAARSDEHIQVLSNLTDVLASPALADELAHTTNAERIVQVLNGQAEVPATEPQLPDFALARTITYPAGAGLHARPATMFVDMAGLFRADIRVRHNDKTADGKAMSSLLRLGVAGGSSIVISAEGPDANAALDALCDGVAAGLGDEAHTEMPSVVADRHYDGEQLNGGAGAPGIAIAPLIVWQPGDVQITAVAGTVAEEGAKLDAALQQAIKHLETLIAESEQSKQQDQQGIFRAHRALLRDPDVVADVRAALSHGVSAASAWWQSLSQRAAEQSQVADERLAARAADWLDIGRRVLALLDPSAVGSSAPVLTEPAILVAADLTPSQTATLDKEKVLAIVTAQGGPTSHTAILARALGIPALVGMGDAVLQAQSQRAIADGDAGILVIAPTDNDLTQAEAAQRAGEAARQAAYEERFQPALTADGTRIEVVGNTGSVTDTNDVVEHGGEGVGLLRSEFLFLGRDTAPTEDEQYQAYKAMVETLNGFPLIIRTLDIGGDKVVPYLNLPHEDNPFLGVRGIRLCLQESELFRTQLRAIYRASQHGPIKIMFPMIGLLEELRSAKAIAEEVRVSVGAESIDLGIMIEVPSAVAMADALAREADFFSIGTNDLTQYTLAMDRMNPALAKQADALHPAVLHMINSTCVAAKAHNRWVGVCGGVAAEPLAAQILVGLGVTELSMNARAIPTVKQALRGVSLRDCQALAQQALQQTTAQDVRALEATHG